MADKKPELSEIATIVDKGTPFKYDNKTIGETAPPKFAGAPIGAHLQDVFVNMTSNTSKTFTFGGEGDGQRAFVSLRASARAAGKTIETVASGGSAPQIIVVATADDLAGLTIKKNDDKTYTLTTKDNKSVIVPADTEIGLTNGKNVKSGNGFLVPVITKTELLETIAKVQKGSQPLAAQALEKPAPPPKGSPAEIISNGTKFEYNHQNRTFELGRQTGTLGLNKEMRDVFVDFSFNGKPEINLTSEGNPRAIITMGNAAKQGGRTITPSGDFPPELIVVATQEQLNSMTMTLNKKEGTITLTGPDKKSLIVPAETKIGLSTGETFKGADNSRLPVITATESLNTVMALAAAAKIAPIPPMPSAEEQKKNPENQKQNEKPKQTGMGGR